MDLYHRNYIGTTLVTTYVKREDIKAFLKKEQAPAPELAPVIIHESPQPSRKTQPKKGIRPMD